MKMPEFEEYNRETKEWEIFSISRYNEIRRSGRYSMVKLEAEI